MPRKAKDTTDVNEKDVVKKEVISKKIASNKTTRKKSSSKSSTTKIEKPTKQKATKASNKKESTPKVSKATTKNETTSKVNKTSNKKESTSKTIKASSKKTTSTKTAKASTKKVTSTKTAKASTKKSTSAKTAKASTKKSTSAKTAKANAQKATSTKTTKASTKKTTSAKTTKASTKKATSAKTAKASTKKITSAKPTATKSSSNVMKKNPEKIEIIEYYDLPYRYNETVVKIIAQTPTTLFVYWDISDEDKKRYIEQYGEYFYNNTKPVLIVHNLTKNYSFEIDINDYANSWYLKVNDSKCEYKIELGRRGINKYISIPNNYLYISSSNELESPNDHILFETMPNIIYFKNVKTGEVTSIDISSLSFLRKIGKLYNMKEFYDKLYTNKNFSFDEFNLRNPSSGNPTSTFR